MCSFYFQACGYFSYRHVSLLAMIVEVGVWYFLFSFQSNVFLWVSEGLDLLCWLSQSCYLATFIHSLSQHLFCLRLLPFCKITLFYEQSNICTAAYPVAPNSLTPCMAIVTGWHTNATLLLVILPEGAFICHLRTHLHLTGNVSCHIWEAFLIKKASITKWDTYDRL